MDGGSRLTSEVTGSGLKPQAFLAGEHGGGRTRTYAGTQPRPAAWLPHNRLPNPVIRQFHDHTAAGRLLPLLGSYQKSLAYSHGTGGEWRCGVAVAGVVHAVVDAGRGIAVGMDGNHEGGDIRKGPIVSTGDIEEGRDAYNAGGLHPVYIGDVHAAKYEVMSKLGWGQYSTV